MNISSNNEISLDAIKYMINHTFLPPNVPQSDDFDPEKEMILLSTVCYAFQSFKAAAGQDEQVIIDNVAVMINNLKSVQDEGDINETRLENALRKLPENGETIPLHIRAQNAGLIISKVSNGICFEAFELSPLNESVMNIKGRLRRSFPASAIVVSLETFGEKGFQGTLAQTIAMMSHQAAPGTKPKVKKACQQHDEERDTTHPMLVTEHLMSFLMAAGKPANVSAIWKNTREEILWKNCKMPWRRSPTWLLVRVVMQLGFSRQTDNSSEDFYKAFMVFFFAYVLRLSQKYNQGNETLHSDTLSAMNAKLSRRLLKLGEEKAKPWIENLERVMSTTQSLLERRWLGIMKGASPSLDLQRLKSIKPQDDTVAHLQELDDYIVSLDKRERNKDSCIFKPDFALPIYQPEGLPYDVVASKDYQTFNLAAFENWVELSLPGWIESHVTDETTCGLLMKLMKSYHELATSQYRENPEGSSIMLLTIMELWVACDRSACILYNFLPEYALDIPVELLQSLILPFKGQINRLNKVERHIKDRQFNAKTGIPSILRSYGEHSAFSVRYFDQSSKHQDLLRRIETKAFSERENKCSELAKKKEQYGDLMQLHEKSDCEYFEVAIGSFNDYTETRHSVNCKKCLYKKQAAALSIEVHEWPLPTQNLEAKSVVFELMVPTAFGQWRDTAIFILNNVLECEHSSQNHPRAAYNLQKYLGLSSFFENNFLRVGLLSEAKPHINTHRRNKSVGAIMENEVCLPNGLRFQYYDGEKDVFISSFHCTDSVLNLCTYKLPKVSSSLQEFLVRPLTRPNGLPPNTVIARQSNCPDHLSLDEFKALCAMPLGYQIQWMNILCQLSIPSIDFTKIETSIFLLQVIYQAGPNERTGQRASREILFNESFGRALLLQLRKALQRIKKNWESSRALESFIRLATSLLCFALSTEIQEECLKYLATAREIAFGWLKLLEDKVQQIVDDTRRTDFLSYIIDVALVCSSTFDVELDDLRKILSCSSSATILIQSSIIIQQNLSSVLGKSDVLLLIALERWRKLSHRALPILVSEVVEKDSTCLDEAVKSSWSDYQSGKSWQPVASPHNYWLFSTTAPQPDIAPLSVHFNLLTAELLANGRPLSRLHSAYEKHPTYFSLFGNSVLEVLPSTVPGMDFSVKTAYAGYTIHLGIKLFEPQSTDLLIHTVKCDRKYDLLPSRIFYGKLPASFIEDFVQWYDYDSKSVEFRPITNPWCSSPDNWWLTNVGSRWRLAKDVVSMVSVLSDSARTLSGIFSALEEPLRIHMLFNEASGSLDIEMRKLQLAFDFRPGSDRIYSRQFRGMFIDSNQCIGTLVGLQNKLVLRDEKLIQPRITLIPEGKIVYQRLKDHVAVMIDRGTATKVHVYSIDELLGRTMDNGNLQSKLFLCYLHGLTSWTLPDLLTGRTGTEQALSILKSAAVKSFDVLTENNLEILERIAKLTPGRTYYPANMCVMQTVEWDSELSFLSQHGSFIISVQTIFNQANDGEIFYAESFIVPPKLGFANPQLLQRDLIRSSTFRVSNFGAEEYTTQYDAIYTARDCGQQSERAARAFVISSLIFQTVERRGALHERPLEKLTPALWVSLAACRRMPGPNRTLESRLLKFDSKWLTESTSQEEPLAAWWCRAHLSFSHSSQQYNKYLVMMWLSTTAFAKNADMEVIHTMAAFYNVPDIAWIMPPPIDEFELFRGAQVNRKDLLKIIRCACRAFQDCPEANLPALNHEGKKSANQRRMRTFQSNQDMKINSFITELEEQWPCKRPRAPANFDTYLDTNLAMNGVRLEFEAWFKNYCFYKYLEQIEGALRQQVVDPVLAPSRVLLVPKASLQIGPRYISSCRIFAAPAPSISLEAPARLKDLVRTESQEEKEITIPRLNTLLADLKSQASTKPEDDYQKYLSDSLVSLKIRAKKSSLNAQDRDITLILKSYLSDNMLYAENLYSAMKKSLTGDEQTAHGISAKTNQWPRISTAFFLQQLTQNRWVQLTTPWKECIIKYGLALTEIQRAERLVSLAKDDTSLTEELLNVGHQNWKPSEFPESLLLEVESGIIIREVQEDIAHQMRMPPSNENAAMQLNMGDGKSSVIVPIVAAHLADRRSLVRVIVAKPQSKQMSEMLVSKLGGLLDRRIYHMPFSRALRLNISQADAIGKIYRDCMENRGILLLQPEHILSFKLMGIECLATNQESVGKSLLNTQHFIDTNSRDIVDESDENFSVKFELIYTMGTQRPIELSPGRWIVIQTVLGLVAHFARGVKKELPLSIEVDDRWQGRFPKIRLLRIDAQKLIIERVAKHICEVGIVGLPVSRQPEDVRQAIFNYITKCDLTAREIAQVENKGNRSFWTDSTRNPLLLIRGLIAGGVLSFTLSSKRWRVNYGLDYNRQPKTKLAVPFRAKDNPAPRAEFSHPDIVIVLTLLSYYYGGLKNEDLFLSFSHLLTSDQAQIEYGDWVGTAPALPYSFRQLSGVNLKDHLQCVQEVFPALRYSKGVIDYFLSHIVFPKEMREFPFKISASGWDIGQEKTHPTTSFSGTNDSRHLLPLSVKHLDLPEQRHTNALVLEYLLQDENSVELLSQGDETTDSDAELLLSTVTKMSPTVRVILDVGAQILELDNLGVAKTWLKKCKHDDRIKAVVFFNDSDDLVVLDRKGQIELLQTSPFSKQLDLCLIFLDEAHTRGTDLKLPSDYRAAVTLGANLTKDRLVQACMRMRKLGKGQSVVFCIPEEIQRKILERTSKQANTTIEVGDVLNWSISETCIDLRRSMPLWATQGHRFEQQKQLWAKSWRENGLDFSQFNAQDFLEEESQTLDYRYRPHAASKTRGFSGWDEKNENIRRIIERCQEFDSLNFNSATLQEEQERELSPEIEQEGQVERPAPANPANHSTHLDLKIFARTGEIDQCSPAILPAFGALRTTSAAKLVDISQFPQDLHVTADYARTVEPIGKEYISDAYQRPIQWILTSTDLEHPNIIKNMIIISPFEANELLSLIKQHRQITLHLYAPRSNLDFEPLDALTLFTFGKPYNTSLTKIPRSFIVQLNLFAGQLFFSSFTEYVEVCEMLGLAWMTAEKGVVVEADGFIVCGDEGGAGGIGKQANMSGFKQSPVEFFRVLMMKIRRNCEGIEKTHLGRVLSGVLLEKRDFSDAAESLRDV